jgi:hypothetical protein
MAKSQHGTIEDRITHLKSRIEQWRRERRPGGAMPPELWDEAAALSREHGIAATARALRVGYAGLRSRAAKTPELAAGPRLVEFRAMPAMPPAPAEPGHVIEVRRSDGSELTVKLAPGCDFDLGALVCAFGRLS